MPLPIRSEEHTSELQSHDNLVCRLLLEKKKPSAGPRNHPPRRFGSPHFPTSSLVRPSSRWRAGRWPCSRRRRLSFSRFFFFNNPPPPKFSPFPHPAPLRF